MADHSMNDPAPDKPLTPDEEALERLLDRRPTTREGLATKDAEAVRLQEAIDASIRESFAPRQAPADLLARLRDAEQATRPPEPAKARTRLPSWAIAAVLLLGVGSWLFSVREFFDLTAEKGYAKLTVGEIYDLEVARGFEPDWFCEDEKRFADTFAERQGEGVWLRPLPEGVRMAGLAYLGGLSPETTSLLANADETPILVLVDRAERVDDKLLRAKSPELNVYTERLGLLKLVEISPLPEARVLPSLYLRAPPAEPTGIVPGSPEAGTGG